MAQDPNSVATRLSHSANADCIRRGISSSPMITSPGPSGFRKIRMLGGVNPFSSMHDRNARSAAGNRSRSSGAASSSRPALRAPHAATRTITTADSAMKGMKSIMEDKANGSSVACFR